MTVGHRIVELLRQEGVSTIFSQGDITTRDVLLHAERAGMKIVGPHHEASTVFAAMGYYSVTGQVQAAFGAQGPGVANLLPAAVAAAREFIPVLIFGARRHSGAANAVRRGNWLFAPMLPLFQSVCKFSASINHPAEVDEVVQQAFRQALSGTPGPVYVEYDAMMHVQAWDYPALTPPSRYRAGPRPVADAAIAQAVALLQQSKSPVMLGGEAVQHARCREAFLRLGEMLGAPMLTTFAGSGLVPADHPQGLLLQTAAAAQAIESSDLLLAIGTCFPEGAYYGRLGPFAAGDAERRVIVVEPDAAAVGINRPVDLALIGDLAQAIEALTRALNEVPGGAAREGPGGARPRRPRLEEWRSLAQDELARELATYPQNGHIHPSRMMIEARRAVPDDATIVLDGGITIFYQHAFFEKRSGDFVYGAHYSHLGCGLPQAIGAQLAQAGDRRVCLITGDGALGFHFMEFETAVRHQLPIVVIVNDDHALGAEMAAHMQHIGHGVEVAFSPMRYDRMAQAMGGHGEHVERAEDIGPAIRRAWASGKTALVQIVTDPDANHRDNHPFAAARRAWIHADVEDKYGSQ